MSMGRNTVADADPRKRIKAGAELQILVAEFFRVKGKHRAWALPQRGLDLTWCEPVECENHSTFDASADAMNQLFI